MSVLALSACNNPPDTGDTGGGPTVDMGAPTLTCPSGGTPPIPDATNQTLPCCYRASQADHQSMPELRLRYLNITGPARSGLISAATQLLLNTSLGNETFNWLVRGSGGTGDGPFTIQTGYGTRDVATGTYSFSTMARYTPVTLTGTISGETVTTQPDDGTLIVPVFDPMGTTLEVELQLHNVQVVSSTFSSDRSCIGAYGTRPLFTTTAATLSGFLTVADTRGANINVSGVLNAQLCTLLASTGFTEPSSTTHYCDMDQSMWAVKPDSLCPATGQCTLDDGSGSTCSHDGTGATPCNAWQLVSGFAAVGVDITD